MGAGRGHHPPLVARRPGRFAGTAEPLPLADPAPSPPPRVRGRVAPARTLRRRRHRARPCKARRSTAAGTSACASARSVPDRTLDLHGHQPRRAPGGDRLHPRARDCRRRAGGAADHRPPRPASRRSSAGGSAPRSTTGSPRRAIRRALPRSAPRIGATAAGAACTSSCAEALSALHALLTPTVSHDGRRSSALVRADAAARGGTQISATREGTAQKISNALLSGAAGFASFVFSLAAFLTITEFDPKILASIVAGAFCLLVSYIASERPNSENARALAALGERLLGVEQGDFTRPAPRLVRQFACPSLQPRSTACSPKSARRSKMPMRWACTIRSPRFPTASISAPKPTS